ECEILESAPGRGNLITRLKGVGNKPSLLLLSHLDVVAANPAEWSVPPFSGLVKDGYVWGRGTLDMKSMTAIEVMVMKLLKRNNVKLKGDLILAATADEERGGQAGAGWLAANHPDKVKAEYVINEGGGQAIPMNGKNIFTVQTAEKGILWLKVKAKGKPGHGSIPGAADNAVLRMSKVVEKLGTYREPLTLIPTVKQFLKTMASENPSLKEPLETLMKNLSEGDEILDKLAEHDKALAEEFRAMLRMTIAPTMIRGGIKENIIPSECEAVFDCRILPGQTTSEALNKIKTLLGEFDLEKLEFEVIQSNEPSESTLDSPLFQVISTVLKEFDPTCKITPILLTGGTDSRFFRRLGAVCYGFHPLLSDLPYGEMLKMIHGVDERISIRNLVFGTTILYNVVKRFLA
ncbi:M20/M25/M40 family metallo-hydrolase, partial [Candidatus Bathyarchaeota archaeon]|nr:M20/M25/M40 family metallo-hydrolase [Candidatus Bathyarchaeota archaeon]